MSKSRKSCVSRMESASSIDRTQHEALVQHIMQQIDKIISEKSIYKRLCLKAFWLLIQKDNIGVDQLYITIRKMLVDYNLTIDKFYTNEAQLQTEIDKSRKTLLYILRTVAEGYMICKDRNSSRFENEWSRYNQDFDELDFIAEGAFGKVYKARCRLDGAEYAIKKVYVTWSSDFSSVIEEVKIIARLNHPNIVNYKTSWLEPIIESTSKKRMRSTNCTDSSVGFGDSDEEMVLSQKENSPPNNFYNREVTTFSPKQLKGVILYIQMFCCQQTLRQWLDDRNQNMSIQNMARSRPENLIQLHNQSVACVSPIGMETLIDIFKQLVKGLHYIHSRGITHHDINADNVLLTPNENGYCVQLCDFGLAYPRQDSHDELSLETYLQGNPKNDMVSLATILLEMLEPCKTDRDRIKILKDLEKGIIPKDMVANHPRFVQIIMKLVHEKESQKFDTAQLLEELNKLSDHNDQRISFLIAENERLKMKLNLSRL